MANCGPMPHTRARLVWHWRQPGIGRQRVHGVTTRQVERGHQRPRCCDPADTFNTLEACRGRSPRGILRECRGNFALDLRELRLEGRQQLVHPRTHLCDHLRVLHEGMELVADLLAQIEQVVTLREALLYDIINLVWRCPRLRL